MGSETKIFNFGYQSSGQPIPVTARSTAWVCGRSLAGIAGSNPALGYGCLSLVSVVCCEVEVSASGWSLVKRSPTECGVSECDHEASIMRRAWPNRGCCAMEKKNHPDTLFAWAKRWGSVVIFRSQKGSASKKVWVTLLQPITQSLCRLR
jgi:hypothetical protein